MKQSHTTVLERNTEWKGRFETEPYEAGWAGEAIFFVRVLEASAAYIDADAQVQISPDGIHWANEWSTLSIDAAGGDDLLPGIPFRQLAALGRRAAGGRGRQGDGLSGVEGVG